MSEPQMREQPLAPDTLTVLYDENCELCRRCRAWLEGQRQLVPLAFVAAGSEAAAVWAEAWAVVSGGQRLPLGDDLVVFAADGSVWVGPDAFIVCLWALAEHRHAAGRLSSPAMRPLAKRLFHAVSAGRGTVSSLLSSGTDDPSWMAEESCSPADGCKP